MNAFAERLASRTVPPSAHGAAAFAGRSIDQELVGRVPLDEVVPAVPGGFAAACAVCEWEGQSRPSSLTALRDFDRHVVSPGHVRAMTEARVELCRDCDHATDGHDRRGDNLSCDECIAEGGPCR